MLEPVGHWWDSYPLRSSNCRSSRTALVAKEVDVAEVLVRAAVGGDPQAWAFNRRVNDEGGECWADDAGNESQSNSTWGVVGGVDIRCT